MSATKITSALSKAYTKTLNFRVFAGGDKTRDTGEVRADGTKVTKSDVVPRSWTGKRACSVPVALDRRIGLEHTALDLWGYSALVALEDIKAGDEIGRIPDMGDTGFGYLALIREDMLGDALGLKPEERMAILEDQEDEEERRARESARNRAILKILEFCGSDGLTQCVKKIGGNPGRYGEPMVVETVKGKKVCKEWNRAIKARESARKRAVA